MTNLSTVLPEFDSSPFSHVLPSLEKSLISIVDLLTLDALDVAKRAQVPPGEVKKLSDALLDALKTGLSDTRRERRDDTGTGTQTRISSLASTVPHAVISTLDDTLDHALGGGIAAGYLTEIVGER